MTAGVQVFVYPEELGFISPEALAAQISGLGCTGVSMALVYHRARRVFPRHAHVSTLAGSTAYFPPDRKRYGALVPDASPNAELAAAVLRFREACRREGLSFRSWVVGLHNEGLVTRHPEAAAQGPDGTPLGHSLCPSAPAAVEYLAALVGDIATRFEPDLIDLEAWQYPAWEPSYTLTLSLQPLTPTAALLATQCFCEHCCALMGSRAEEIRRRVVQASAAAASEQEESGSAALEDLVAFRAAGAGRIAGTLVDAAKGEGAKVRLFGSGAPRQARLQGLSPATFDRVDSALVGCARLVGDELIDRFTEMRSLLGGIRATASTNWTPDRSPQSMADDARRLVEAGAGGLALYNLSLVPEAGLDAFREAARAFSEAAA